MLEEQSPGKPARKCKEPELDSTEYFLRQADRIAVANLRGNHKLATRLSAEYANARKIVIEGQSN
ncbi:MAG: hypothetical protein DMG72_06295 [Acidobacteria bacterium]|nr:MAG: hypothetical protein DMG72_06295 [Acidobacteriota bacterium]